MKYLILVCTLLGWSVVGHAQRIILDLPTKAGELTLFPEVGKENNYYYVADKARLATDESGRPKFSFLRYVANQKSDAGEASITQGEGGGILHAMVSLGVTDEQRQEAERELKRINPEGELIGPVIFKSGTFGLITSFTDENGELAKQVVGVGQAPILDGQQAAISIHLTRLGATLLWNSFKTATPDISFSFNMTMDGYRLPKEAVIEANFKDIYESMEIGLQAGIGGTVSAGAGAGGNGGSGGPRGANAGSNGAANGSTNNGASQSTNPGESTETNTAAEENGTNSNNTSEPATPIETSEATESETNETGSNTSESGQSSESSSSESSSTESGSNDTAGTDATSDRSSDEEPMAMAAAPSGGGGAGASVQGQVPFYFGADLRFQFEKLRKEGAIKITQIGSDEGMDELINTAYSKLADMMFDRIETSGSQQHDPARALNAMTSAAGGNRSNSSPVSGITFSYKMKKKRRTGSFRMDLNKWTTDELVMRFDENIGNLSRYQNDPQHFHQVNTDDPLYRQREVFAILDGYNAADFGNYVNFVTVRMEKTHESGDITHEEVKIDRKNINQSGNAFNMVYGWKGDDDRDKWMEYDYEVLWSFFGDVEVREPMQESSFSAINLAPPFRKKEIEFQADPVLLDEQEIRIVTVNVFFQIGGKEFSRQVILNPSRDMLSGRTDYLTTDDDPGYEYEISWRLRGNRTVKTERLQSNDGLMFVDELPTESPE